MDLAIVNHSSTNSWHIKGQQKLRESLGNHKPLLFSSAAIPILYSFYEDKIYAIKQARDIGFKKILWLDSSITLIEGKTLQPIYDWIETNGVYLYPSGYKSGQTANSKALSFYGTNTNEQMLVPEVASNVVGINMETEIGKTFLEEWIKSLQSEANRGIEWPSEYEAMIDNPDPRFLFSRQDQTTATLAAWKTKAPIDNGSLFVYRDGEEVEKESSIFKLKGL